LTLIFKIIEIIKDKFGGVMWNMLWEFCV
jgi:hypothetical protein